LLEIELVLPPHPLEMPRQIGLHRSRQHRDAVLVALAASDDQLVGGKVDILNAQPAAFEQPEPGSVEQVRHEPGRALQPLEHCPDLVAGEDDRQAHGAFRAHDPVEPRQVDLQHVPVQEQEGAQGLVLGGGGHPAIDRQRGEEAGHFRGAHLGRMALGAEEEDVALDPRDVGLLGAPAVVASAQGGANAVEEARPGRGHRNGDRPGLPYDERPDREGRAGGARQCPVDGEREHDRFLRSGRG
jgi:hypothetical protein